MADSPLSVLITRFPYESVLSGEEWHTITLAEKLRERGHSVAFMGSCRILLEELAKRDFAAHKQPGGPVPVSSKKLLLFLLSFPYFTLSWGLFLARLKKRHKLTAVYMHSLSEKVLLTPSALLLGLRVVWVEHQRWGRWMLGNPLRYIYRLWAKHVEIIGVSPLYRDSFKLLHLPEMRTHIITNGIDLQFFRPDVEPLPLGHNAIHIGTMARLSADKGVDILLDAFAQVCERAKREQWTTEDLRLHLVGEGPLKEELQARVRTLPCREKVHFYVPYLTISRSDAPRFMKTLDIFVLPSALPDPFGLVAAESMAVGTATVVTQVCGIRYQLTENVDSMMVSAGDASALEEALATLLGSAELRARLGAAGRKTAEKEFSLDVMVDKYVALLHGNPVSA